MLITCIQGSDPKKNPEGFEIVLNCSFFTNSIYCVIVSLTLGKFPRTQTQLIVRR